MAEEAFVAEIFQKNDNLSYSAAAQISQLERSRSRPGFGGSTDC